MRKCFFRNCVWFVVILFPLHQMHFVRLLNVARHHNVGMTSKIFCIFYTRKIKVPAHNNNNPNTEANVREWQRERWTEKKEKKTSRKIASCIFERDENVCYVNRWHFLSKIIKRKHTNVNIQQCTPSVNVAHTHTYTRNDSCPLQKSVSQSVRRLKLMRRNETF